MDFHGLIEGPTEIGPKFRMDFYKKCEMYQNTTKSKYVRKMSFITSFGTAISPIGS